MKLRINYVRMIIIAFTYAFLVICILFPLDIYNIKIPVFLILIIMNLRLFINKIMTSKYRIVLCFGFLFPLFTMLSSFIITNDLVRSISGGYVGILFFLIIIFVEKRIEYQEMLMKVLIILMLIPLILAGLDVLGFSDVNSSKISELIRSLSMGYIGKSYSYAFYYKIFLKTSPLLIILVGEWLYKEQYIPACLAIVSMVLSGTRANVFICGAVVIGVLFINRRGTKHFRRIIPLLWLSLVTIIIIYANKMYYYVIDIFQSAGSIQSDLVRSGHMEGLKLVYENKPSFLLTGMGFGTSFYSYGSKAYINTMEWAYVDLFRQIGIVFFIVFCIFLLIPIISKKIKTYKKIIYIGYLIIAATNPLIYSSTAYIMYIYIYLDIYKMNIDSNKKEILNNNSGMVMTK